jgi:predicted nucleic acid-binding protein
MRAYLLDTNIVSYLADPASVFHGRVAEAIRSLPSRSRLAVSVLTLYELAYGYARDPGHARLLAIIRQEGVAVVALPEAGAEVFARVKNDYRLRTGTQDRALARHNVDLVLASTAIVEGMALVSNDAIFKRLAEVEPQLVVEDWTA